MKTQVPARWIFVFLVGLLISCRPHAGTLPDFTALVEDNQDAVVNISTLQRVEGRRGQGQRVPEFFRHFFEGMEDHFDTPPRDAESQGSGFIISRDGYILTNYHVVRNADRILVRLQDRRELEAELVGQDEQSDLALLRIEAGDLPVVRIGSSRDLRVGAWVLAIGAPFGFESTVTAGIVSAVGRSLPNENYVPFIQTDVAINPGNSGGPLFNLDGEVVGINSQIVSRSGGFMGLSFAIPIDMAMDVVKQLRETGRVARGWLGVLIQDVDRDLAESFGLDKPAGALVAQVMSDSPAAKGGIQAGDVVLEFNGERIHRSSQLPHVVGRVVPGTEAEAVVMRDGKRVTLKVPVGELPEDGGRRSRDAQVETPEVQADPLGLTVEPMTAQERENMGLDHGVKITDVRPGPASRAGIRRGDILRTLNNMTVDDPEALEEILTTLPQNAWVPALIQRGENPRFLALRVEADGDAESEE
ncbi:DegQ family serine endoprotease [Isoalcanivorax indicus]|uniref:DegQ family serine endoprotease n=1 Tax=Isoalcanivorax indicus TaxID=2202653 RepID=UPI000DB90532|nr:DegQ family serine endoprotease [Isoalcanivorax indicus]